MEFNIKTQLSQDLLPLKDELPNKGIQDSASTRAEVDEADALVSEDTEKFSGLEGS